MFWYSCSLIVVVEKYFTFPMPSSLGLIDNEVDNDLVLPLFDVDAYASTFSKLKKLVL